MVVHIVPGCLGTEVQGIETVEAFPQAALEKVILILLTVIGRVGGGSRNASFSLVVIGFRVPLAFVEHSEEVGSGLELAEIGVGSGLPFSVTEIALAPVISKLGAEAHSVREAVGESQARVPGPEGACSQP